LIIHRETLIAAKTCILKIKDAKFLFMNKLFNLQSLPPGQSWFIYNHQITCRPEKTDSLRDLTSLVKVAQFTEKVLKNTQDTTSLNVTPLFCKLIESKRILLKKNAFIRLVTKILIFLQTFSSLDQASEGLRKTCVDQKGHPNIHAASLQYPCLIHDARLALENPEIYPSLRRCYRSLKIPKKFMKSPASHPILYAFHQAIEKEYKTLESLLKKDKNYSTSEFLHHADIFSELCCQAMELNLERENPLFAKDYALRYPEGDTQSWERLALISQDHFGFNIALFFDFHYTWLRTLPSFNRKLAEIGHHAFEPISENFYIPGTRFHRWQQNYNRIARLFCQKLGIKFFQYESRLSIVEDTKVQAENKKSLIDHFEKHKRSSQESWSEEEILKFQHGQFYYRLQHELLPPL